MRKDKLTIFLNRKGYSSTTITKYNGLVKKIENHCDAVGLKLDKLSLNELYNINTDFKNMGKPLSSIKQYFVALKYYYFAINRKDNPVIKMVFAKGEYTKPTNLLTDDEMVYLYTQYNTNRLIDKRDVVMLGLVIFQGVKTSELEQLEFHHIDLDEQTIYIPSTSTTNSRTIKLRLTQKEHLENYIYTLRDILIMERGSDTSRLFCSLGTGSKLKCVTVRILKTIRTNNKSFKNFTQLRESRISLWLKEYGTRQTQYLSGFRYASSLERYKVVDLENLGAKLNRMHPMERCS